MFFSEGWEAEEGELDVGLRSCMGIVDRYRGLRTKFEVQ